MASTIFEPLRHRWTVAEYHRLAETGLLDPAARVELVEGELIDMPPIGSLHGGTVNRWVNFLAVALAGKAIVAPQNPVTLDEHSELQPDIAILRRRDDYYTNAHPLPGDVLWLIEVADSTVRYDRDIKLPLYARAGIPEAWLLDLANRQLEIYRDPSPEGYRQMLKPHRQEQIVPSFLPELHVELAPLL
jgi:Uma2 family endonuclease